MAAASQRPSDEKTGAYLFVPQGVASVDLTLPDDKSHNMKALTLFESLRWVTIRRPSGEIA